MLVESFRYYAGPAETRKAHRVRIYFTESASLEPPAVCVGGMTSILKAEKSSRESKIIQGGVQS